MSRPTTRSQRERTVIRTARAAQRRKRKADGTATGGMESREQVVEAVDRGARRDAPWFRVLLIVGGVVTALLLTRQAYDYSSMPGGRGCSRTICRVRPHRSSCLASLPSLGCFWRGAAPAGVCEAA